MVHSVFKKHNVFWVISFLTLFAAFLHFYNLNWGATFYFHPDERNIASSVTQLNFPSAMNPHFFAYGSLPIYTIYFTGVLVNFFQKFANFNPDQIGVNSLAAMQSNLLLTGQSPVLKVSFEQAIIISRFYSAIFSTLLVPLLYLSALKIKDATTGIVTAFLATFSTGLIQFGHFGTFEMWLTFFSVVIFWQCTKLKNSANDSSLFLLALISGVLIATKISHVAVVPLVLFVLLLQETYQNKNRHHLYKFFRWIRGIVLFFAVVFLVYVISNPFVFLDTTAFLGSMKYESSVALGTLNVFYTGGFYQSIPVLYQFIRIYPFLLSPVITLLFIPSFLYLSIVLFRSKNASYLLLIIFYLLLFLSQVFLFAKWTRYIVPTLPFVYLIVAIGISDFLKLTKRVQVVKYFALSLVISISALFALSYFITAFVKPDTRIMARNFARKTIPANAHILSEVYDLGITPFNDFFHTIDLFNFYDLDPVESYRSPSGTIRTRLTERFDGASNLPFDLREKLQKTDYIILPSQRILKNRLADKKQFPKGYIFYEGLTSGSLGFMKVYETPCDMWCKIVYLGDPVYSFEETANVFDRPTVFIFKKI